MFGVTCTCSWLELFVVIWSWVKNDAAPFLGVGGLVGGYVLWIKMVDRIRPVKENDRRAYEICHGLLTPGKGV